MSWSLAILDDGIANAVQASVGKTTALEHDYYRDRVDTDEGAGVTHGSRVFLAALETTRSLDVLDLKIGAPGDQGYSYDMIETGLRGLLALGTGRVGAVNMSFAGDFYPAQFVDELDALVARGVIPVAAAGNSGSHAGLERPGYPAVLPDVIAVGSHDGHGHPTSFSQNGPAIAVLADGEDVPDAGSRGTSFAAPQVAATVANVQAIVHGLTGHTLGVAAMIDALREGGAGPRSQPDPADGVTRYFLHDHNGSLDYAWSRYGGTPTTALEYIAGYGDLIAALGADAAAGRRHFEHTGSIEERAIRFDALHYLASYRDLALAFGENELAGATHYLTAGVREGRTVHFDGLRYIASYKDLAAAFGADELAGTHHYVDHGAAEQRDPDRFDAAQYLANYADLRAAFGADEAAAAVHYITYGIAEGRDDQPHDFLL
ncbi:MAG: S8 family serine peptidase [Geminicoccaceae bacterium]